MGSESMSFSRRTLLQAAALAGLGCRTTGSLAQGVRPPNIILIMADDLGYGDLGCYGSDVVATPRIDSLARGGMRFTDYHSNGAVCSPTRAALMTGSYQQRCGVDGVVLADGERHLGMPLSATTMAEILGGVGYTTGIIGKWHLGYEPKFGPNAQGFDYFRGFVSGNIDYISHHDRMGYDDWWENVELVPEDGYLTDLIGEHAARFVDDHADEPFLLYVPHGAPHSPYQGRGDKAIRSNGAVVTYMGDPARYPEMVGAIDDSVERIMGAVEANGLVEDTIVIFCSDNGPNGNGSAGELRGLKGSLWEGGHRVPCIWSWPGVISPGSVTGTTAMSMDILPTLAGFAGASITHRVDGVDLGSVLRSEGELGERKLYWKYGNKLAMRHGPWKYVKDRKESGLFHLGNDLGETTNLSEAERVRAETMHEQVSAWFTTIESGVPFVT